MKALRALYIAVVYILSLPLFVITVIGVALWDIVFCIRYKYDFEDYKDFQSALWQGAYLGHMKNVYWVKYGKNYMEKYLEEGLI